MANWRNLERQLEQASNPPKSLESTEVYNMRMALIYWPGLKTVIEELIKRVREDREYADAYRVLLARGEIPEGRPGTPRDSMG